MAESKTQRRVYMVHHKHSKTSKLVRASNQSQAVRHVTENDYECRVASQDDCIRLIAEGIKVENAGGAA